MIDKAHKGTVEYRSGYGDRVLRGPYSNKMSINKYENHSAVSASNN